jgi:hypothetical protein
MGGMSAGERVRSVLLLLDRLGVDGHAEAVVDDGDGGVTVVSQSYGSRPTLGTSIRRFAAIETNIRTDLEREAKVAGVAVGVLLEGMRDQVASLRAGIVGAQLTTYDDLRARRAGGAS